MDMMIYLDHRYIHLYYMIRKSCGELARNWLRIGYPTSCMTLFNSLRIANAEYIKSKNFHLTELLSIFVGKNKLQESLPLRHWVTRRPINGPSSSSKWDRSSDCAGFPSQGDSFQNLYTKMDFIWFYFFWADAIFSWFFKSHVKNFMLGKKMEIKESHPKFNRKFSEVALLKTQILLRRFYSQTSRWTDKNSSKIVSFSPPWWRVPRSLGATLHLRSLRFRCVATPAPAEWI